MGDVRWLVCRECRDVVPETELTPDERDEWMDAHAAQTGHQEWTRATVTVED